MVQAHRTSSRAWPYGVKANYLFSRSVSTLQVPPLFLRIVDRLERCRDCDHGIQGNFLRGLHRPGNLDVLACVFSTDGQPVRLASVNLKWMMVDRFSRRRVFSIFRRQLVQVQPHHLRRVRRTDHVKLVLISGNGGVPPTKKSGRGPHLRATTTTVAEKRFSDQKCCLKR